MKFLIALCLWVLPLFASDEDSVLSVHKIFIEERENEYVYPGPDDEYERGTPQSTVRGLSRAFHANDFQRATQYMDFRYLPETILDDSLELARKLKVISNRSIWIDIPRLDNTSRGNRKDKLPSYREEIATLKLSTEEIPVFLQRVPRTDGVYVWKVSNETISRIPELYSEFGFGKVGDEFSRRFPKLYFGGMHLWQWILLTILIVGAFLGWSLILKTVVYLFARKETDLAKRRKHFLLFQFRAVAILATIRIFLHHIDPPLQLQVIAGANTLSIIGTAFILVGITDLIFGRLGDSMKKTGNKNADKIMRPIVSLVKFIIYAIAFIMWLDNLGFKVSSLITGLGVGSIAFALAAKSSLEDLISAVTLFTSQPIRVGDFVKIGSTVGTVEEIGLRQTRIRTLNRSVLSLPNSKIVTMELDNFNRRDSYHYRFKLRLRLDTHPDQIRYILMKIQELFIAHPKVKSDKSAARLKEMGISSLDIALKAVVEASKMPEYKEIAEDLHLRILDIVYEAGASLASPDRLVISNQSDSNSVRDDILKTVELLKEQEDLHLPKWPEELTEELENSYDYPAKGSSWHRFHSLEDKATS